MAEVERVAGPTAWAWMAWAAASAALFFVLIGAMVAVAPAFHPDLHLPVWFDLTWIVVFIANIGFAFFASGRWIRTTSVEMFAGYSTLPYATAQVELRDHRTWELLRPEGVDPISRTVSLRLGPERARATRQPGGGW